LYSQTGSVVRFLYNSQYFGVNGNPTKYMPSMFDAIHCTLYISLFRHTNSSNTIHR